MSKFCGVYKSVLSLNQSGTSLEDVLERALDLYKVLHPKQQLFLFVHCWRILKDFLQWSDLVSGLALLPLVRTTIMPKRKSPSVQPTSPNDVDTGFGSESADVTEVTE